MPTPHFDIIQKRDRLVIHSRRSQKTGNVLLLITLVFFVFPVLKNAVALIRTGDFHYLMPLITFLTLGMIPFSAWAVVYQSRETLEFNREFFVHQWQVLRWQTFYQLDIRHIKNVDVGCTESQPGTARKETKFHDVFLSDYHLAVEVKAQKVMFFSGYPEVELQEIKARIRNFLSSIK